MSQSPWATVTVADLDPHISVLTLNRPMQRNAINAEMACELDACLTTLERKEDLRVLLLTGEGSAFSAGADLKERAILAPEQTQKARSTVLRFLDRIEAFRAPVIAMVNGPAVGGAFEIALACDIRVASDRATFCLPEVRRVGAFPGAGGPVRLPRLVGRGRANFIVLTGREFPAQEAMNLALVELVVPHERLLEETLALARQIAGNNPRGISAAKQLILRSADMDFRAAMELSRALRDPMDAAAASTLKHEWTRT